MSFATSFATCDHAALQATVCSHCMKDKQHYASTALHVQSLSKPTSQCYVHTCMMTQIVSWWRLYEHTLFWIPLWVEWDNVPFHPMSCPHVLNIIFHCPIFNFTLQAKLIFPLVNLDVNSPWVKTISHFPPTCWKLVAASSIANNDHLIISIILIIYIIMTAPYSWLGMTHIPISKPSLMAIPLCPNVIILELVQTIHRPDFYHCITWWLLPPLSLHCLMNIIIIITNTLLDE